MSNWKDKCTYLNPQNSAVEIEVNGETLKMYPVSVGKLFELRAIAQPLAASLMTLLADTSTDSGVHQGVDENGDQFQTVMPPSPDLLDARSKHQKEAISELAEAISSKENLAVVGGILVDSLRDEFEPGSSDNPPGAEFINEIPATLLPVFIKGLFKANKGVLGDFGGKTTDLLDTVIGKVKEKAEASARSEMSEKPSEAG